MSPALTSAMERLRLLSGIYPEEILLRAQHHSRKRVFGYTGKIVCPFDEELLSFLLAYNYASMPGIQFMGIGDQGNVSDLYRFTGNCWEKNAALCPYFLVFAQGASGEYIGSLTNYKGKERRYPVACLSYPQANHFTIIGSSFGAFLDHYTQYSATLLSSGKRYAEPMLFTDPGYWLAADEILKEKTANGDYKYSAEENWKMEFGFLS